MNLTTLNVTYSKIHPIATPPTIKKAFLTFDESLVIFDIPAVASFTPSTTPLITFPAPSMMLDPASTTSTATSPTVSLPLY